jgi:PAS domain S-box-containing protein
LSTTSTEKNTELLLRRAAALHTDSNKDGTFPRPDVLTGLAVSLGEALQQANMRLIELGAENQALGAENQVVRAEKEMLDEEIKKLSGHIRALTEQNRALSAQVETLTQPTGENETDQRQYRDLFEYAPDAYLITDTEGVILEANPSAASLLHTRRRELAGTKLMTFVSPADQALFWSLLTRARQVQDLGLGIQPRGKTRLDTAITLSTILDEQGQPIRMHWLVRDVTERRRAMQALNASERRFRKIFDDANLGILLVDSQSRIARANRAMQKIIGDSEEAMLHRYVFEYAHPDDVAIWQAAAQSLLAGEQNLYRYETRYLHRNGSLMWAALSITLLHDDPDSPPFILVLAENITGEKQAAAELAEMRRRLLESGEADRLRLAQELHDGPMQDLYGTVFRAADFLEQVSDPAEQTRLKEVQEMVRIVANRLREICAELRPPTLSNLGLEKAIRSHAERLQEQMPGLEIQLNLSEDGQSLPAHTRLAFFRIYQECIANTVRHAQATRVMVAFHAGEEQAELDIWDNGQGFELPEKWVDLLRGGHSGLAQVAERVQALGGTLKIETRPGGGTLVHVSAPVVEFG